MYWYGCIPSCAMGATGQAIFERARFCPDRGLRAAERRSVRDSLDRALIHHAVARGIAPYTAIAEMGWFQQMLGLGLAVPAARAATGHRIDRFQYAAVPRPTTRQRPTLPLPDRNQIFPHQTAADHPYRPFSPCPEAVLIGSRLSIDPWQAPLPTTAPIHQKGPVQPVSGAGRGRTIGPGRPVSF